MRPIRNFRIRIGTYDSNSNRISKLRRSLVGRPPGELGGSKSMECDIFPFSALTLLVGDRKGIWPVKETGCWFVGGDDLTGALQDL